MEKSKTKFKSCTVIKMKNGSKRYQKKGKFVKQSRC